MESSVLTTYEKNLEIWKEKEQRPQEFKSKSINLTNLIENDQNSRNSQILKISADENISEILEASRKYSFSFNRFELKEKTNRDSQISFSSRFPNILINESQNNDNNNMESSYKLLPNSNNNSKTNNNNISNSIINKNHASFNKLKSVFLEKDYNSFLNMKLNGFKEYNIKKGPYLQQEKKSKEKVFSYLFEQNLEHTKSKKVMQLRLKKISDVIRKKKLSPGIFVEDEKIEKNEKNREKEKKKINLDEFFKKEEKILNTLRQKINKAFNEESRMYNNRQSVGVISLSPHKITI